MKRSIGLFFIMFLLLFSSCRSEQDGKESISNQYYITNRSPLKQNPYIELPLGCVKAKGWLEQMLLRQKEGATGHIEKLYPKAMGDNNGWLGGTTGDQYQSGPYWLYGLIMLAYTLDDQELIDQSGPWIEWMLNSQQSSGYFGPDKDFPNLPGGILRENSADWWPRMVALKVLKQLYPVTRDERIIGFMTRYFQYQLNTLPDKPLGFWSFWSRYRGGDNLMTVYWLYNTTGDKFLLDLAEIIHQQTFNFTDKFLHTDMLRNLDPIHGVNLAQGLKEPVIYYQHHPDEKYIQSVQQAFADLYHFSGQPQGMFGSDELLRNKIPTNGIELCTVVELMFSLQQMIMITGNVSFADHLEKITFNALPAQITDNFMERQYYQQTNQVLITRDYRNFSTIHGGTTLCFGPLTGYPCCTVNMHQGWPGFTRNLWYATPEGGLAAMIYAPCEVTAIVGKGSEVTITEETEYPFEDTIRFKLSISDGSSVSFPLKLRIPGWTGSASVKINDDEVKEYPGGQVARIDRTWNDGDVVEMEIPAQVQLNRWHENSVSVDRGPLNFVLKIKEEWTKVKNTRDPQYFGDYYYEVAPGSPWNYGLIDVPDEEIADHFRLLRNQSISDFPWNQENNPLSIKVAAKRMKDWQMDKSSAGALPYSIQHGQRTEDEIDTVTLIPYGCSTLRIAVFPLVGTYKIMK